MKKIIDAKAGTVTFTFEGLETVTFNPHNATAKNQTYAMLHGFAARIGDNAAIQKSEENGFKVTEGMRREAVMELVEHYLSGSEDWSPRAKAVRKPAEDPYMAELAKRRGCTYAEAQAWFQAKMLADPELTGE